MAKETSDIIRPRQSILIVMLVAYYALIALVVVGALRAQQPIAAWVGIALGVMFLPVIEIYRTALLIGDDALTLRSFLSTRRIAYADIAGYGDWKVWTYRSGMWHWIGIMAQDGRRIDAPISIWHRDDVEHLLGVLRRRAPQAIQISPDPVRSGIGVYAALIIGTLIILATLLLLGPAFERTLHAETLFDLSATAGIALGLGLGIAFGQHALRRSPATFATMSALVMMVLVPVVTMYGNALYPIAWHTARVDVLKHETRTGHGGAVLYLVDLDIGGVRKQLSPSAALWERLGAAPGYSACVAEGALGFQVVADYTQPCRH